MAPFIFEHGLSGILSAGRVFLIGHKKTRAGAGFYKKKAKIIFEEHLFEEEEFPNEQSLG